VWEFHFSKVFKASQLVRRQDETDQNENSQDIGNNYDDTNNTDPTLDDASNPPNESISTSDGTNNDPTAADGAPISYYLTCFPIQYSYIPTASVFLDI
jgi:hypothetical protein